MKPVTWKVGKRFARLAVLIVLAVNFVPAYGDLPDDSQTPSTVQYGSVEQDGRTQGASFRLRRPLPFSLPVSPQLGQSADTLPSVVNPDLNQSFPRQNNLNSALPQAESSASNWHPGVILTGSAGEQSLNPTCDLGLAAQQAQEFQNSPEAAFIYAVDLTKSSQVEVALKEVRRARNLAQATGDPDYFSRAVGQYEETLAAEPENNCIRYSLGWAYYMQAYLLAERARKEARNQAVLAGQAPPRQSKFNNELFSGASILASVLTGTRPDTSVVPHIPGALENTPGWAQPQIKMFYTKCLAALDEVVRRDPHDVWAAVYGVHVREEFDGNHDLALQKLVFLKRDHPDNPAAVFFLADAYARSGNILAGAVAMSQALQLHLQGK